MANNPLAGYDDILFPGGGGLLGSAFYVGDGVVLTAGHNAWGITVSVNPSNRSVDDLPGSTVVVDMREYESKLNELLLNFRPQNPGESNQSYLIDMSRIPVTFEMRSRDTVFADISGNKNLDSSSAGIVLFLGGSADILSSDFGLNADGSDPVKVMWRGGRTGSHQDGALSLSGGFLTYSVTGNAAASYAGPGDSGSGLIVNFTNGFLGVGDRAFVLGNLHSIDPINPVPPNDPNYNNQRGPTKWNWIKVGDFDALHSYLEGHQSPGDVTTSEPTNLIVGTKGRDFIEGSFRSDIILGRDGLDFIRDGDEEGDTVWANDQLFGGAGTDELCAGGGDDLLHGGDFRAYGGSRVALRARSESY